MANENKERKIEGYKVKNLWSVVPGRLSSVSHQKGDLLSADDIETKPGLDRDLHIAELIRIGCLEPVYADAELPGRARVVRETREVHEGHEHREHDGS